MNKSWLPNILTFFRFALAIVVVVLIHVGEQIYFEIACWGVVLAGLTDFLDGMFARKYKLESNFGKFLGKVRLPNSDGGPGPPIPSQCACMLSIIKVNDKSL